jgi:hypothetical protein
MRINTWAHTHTHRERQAGMPEQHVHVQARSPLSTSPQKSIQRVDPLFARSAHVAVRVQRHFALLLFLLLRLLFQFLPPPLFFSLPLFASSSNKIEKKSIKCTQWTALHQKQERVQCCATVEACEQAKREGKKRFFFFFFRWVRNTQCKQHAAVTVRNWFSEGGVNL